MSHPSASFLIFYNYAEAVIIPLMAVVGISGNCITASIMTSQSLSLDFNTTFRHILLMLAAFDSLFLVLATLAGPFNIVEHGAVQLRGCPYYNPDPGRMHHEVAQQVKVDVGDGEWKLA